MKKSLFLLMMCLFSSCNNRQAYQKELELFEAAFNRKVNQMEVENKYYRTNSHLICISEMPDFSCRYTAWGNGAEDKQPTLIIEQGLFNVRYDCYVFENHGYVYYIDDSYVHVYKAGTHLKTWNIESHWTEYPRQQNIIIASYPDAKKHCVYYYQSGEGQEDGLFCHDLKNGTESAAKEALITNSGPNWYYCDSCGKIVRKDSNGTVLDEYPCWVWNRDYVFLEESLFYISSEGSGALRHNALHKVKLKTGEDDYVLEAASVSFNNDCSKVIVEGLYDGVDWLHEEKEYELSKM